MTTRKLRTTAFAGVTAGRRTPRRGPGSILVASLLTAASLGAQPAAPPAGGLTTEQEHRSMMEQLGIRRLRPGPSGNESAPNAANYDEGKANPFPVLPDVLTLKNGTKVTTPAQWA